MPAGPITLWNLSLRQGDLLGGSYKSRRKREEVKVATDKISKLKASVAEATEGLAERDWLLTKVQNLKAEPLKGEMADGGEETLGGGATEVAGRGWRCRIQ